MINRVDRMKGTFELSFKPGIEYAVRDIELRFTTLPPQRARKTSLAPRRAVAHCLTLSVPPPVTYPPHDTEALAAKPVGQSPVSGKYAFT
jgi:hypothetical protein